MKLIGCLAALLPVASFVFGAWGLVRLWGAPRWAWLWWLLCIGHLLSLLWSAAGRESARLYGFRDQVTHFYGFTLSLLYVALLAFGILAVTVERNRPNPTIEEFPAHEAGKNRETN